MKPSNSTPFIQLLEDYPLDLPVSRDWVLWMLRTIEDCDQREVLMNPEWVTADPIRWCTYNGMIKDPEPPMQ